MLLLCARMLWVLLWLLLAGGGLVCC